MFLSFLFVFFLAAAQMGAGMEQSFFLTKGVAVSCTDEVLGVGSLSEVEKQCAQDASCELYASNQSSRTYKKCGLLKRPLVFCDDFHKDHCLCPQGFLLV